MTALSISTNKMRDVMNALKNSAHLGRKELAVMQAVNLVCRDVFRNTTSHSYKDNAALTFPVPSTEGAGAGEREIGKPAHVAWSPDSTLLACGFHEGSVTVRRTSDGVLILFDRINFMNYMHELCFSPPGAELLASTNSAIHVWTLGTARTAASFRSLVFKESMAVVAMTFVGYGPPEQKLNIFMAPSRFMNRGSGTFIGKVVDWSLEDVYHIPFAPSMPSVPFGPNGSDDDFFMARFSADGRRLCLMTTGLDIYDVSTATLSFPRIPRCVFSAVETNDMSFDDFSWFSSSRLCVNDHDKGTLCALNVDHIVASAGREPLTRANTMVEARDQGMALIVTAPNRHMYSSWSHRGSALYVYLYKDTVVAQSYGPRQPLTRKVHFHLRHSTTGQFIRTLDVSLNANMIRDQAMPVSVSPDGGALVLVGHAGVHLMALPKP